MPVEGRATACLGQQLRTLVTGEIDLDSRKPLEPTLQWIHI